MTRQCDGVIVPLLALAMIVAIVGCKRDDEPRDHERAEARPVVEVSVAPVQVGRIEQVLRVTGKTQVLHQEHVNAPIAGKIISLSAMEGSAVKAGDALLVIRTRESQAALDGAKAAAQRASTQPERAEAERAVRVAEESVNDVVVRAPFDGVVASRAVNAGEFITENAELLTLLDLSSLYFLADVPVQSLAQLGDAGAVRVTFAAFPHGDYSATLDNVNPQVDAASQMAKVRLKFSGATPALRGDMIGEARIVTAVHAAAALVPKQAVTWNDETGAATIAIASDSIARVVPVRVGIADTSRVEILAPEFPSGTRVIVVGNHGLQDSTRITYPHAP